MWRIDTRFELAPAERDAVQRLVSEVDLHDGHQPLSDHQLIDLVHGNRPGDAALIARPDDGVDDAPEPIGYAQLSRTRQSWALELLVHPRHRDHVDDHSDNLVGALLDAAVALVRAHGGGRLQWWVFRPDEHIDRIAAAAGLLPGRRLLQMRRALPVEASTAPPAVTRPFEVGRDEGAWLEVNNAAFAWHPEQGGWDLDTIRQREREPWFDPNGFLLHERDGRLAAFCWTKVHADECPPIGEIYVIAVHPDFHGLGLGRALTVAGLRSLTDRGITKGMLYVDADNTAAVALYERLGFTVHHADRAYVADLAPFNEPSDPNGAP